MMGLDEDPSAVLLKSSSMTRVHSNSLNNTNKQIVRAGTNVHSPNSRQGSSRRRESNTVTVQIKQHGFNNTQ